MLGYPFLPDAELGGSPPLVVVSGEEDEAIVERVEKGDDAEEESTGNILGG